MKKEAKEDLKLIDDDRTFASIEEAIKQAQSDIYVLNKLYKKQPNGAEHLLFETFTMPDNTSNHLAYPLLYGYNPEEKHQLFFQNNHHQLTYIQYHPNL